MMRSFLQAHGHTVAVLFSCLGGVVVFLSIHAGIVASIFSWVWIFLHGLFGFAAYMESVDEIEHERQYYTITLEYPVNDEMISHFRSKCKDPSDDLSVKYYIEDEFKKAIREKYREETQ